MLTGHLPFEGERAQAVLYAITDEEPEPVTALRSRLPVEIAAEPLLSGATDEGFVFDWSSDGRYALNMRYGEGISDLWYLKRKDDGSAFERSRYVLTEFAETNARRRAAGSFISLASQDKWKSTLARFVTQPTKGRSRWEAAPNPAGAVTGQRSSMSRASL